MAHARADRNSSSSPNALHLTEVRKQLSALQRRLRPLSPLKRISAWSRPPLRPTPPARACPVVPSDQQLSRLQQQQRETEVKEPTELHNIARCPISNNPA
jgi:hypothetical protein